MSPFSSTGNTGSEVCEVLAGEVGHGWEPWVGCCSEAHHPPLQTQRGGALQTQRGGAALEKPPSESPHPGSRRRPAGPPA